MKVETVGDILAELKPSAGLLDALGLGDDAKAKRREWIGGSDANTIMGGNTERINALWSEKRGERQPDDLSGNIAVMLGSFTEAFNVAWFERQTGLSVTSRGDWLTLPGEVPMSATVDGIVSDDGRVFEAKHTGERISPEDAWARYLPQLAHNSIVANAPGAVLSVIRGNSDWYILEYERDADYEAALIRAESDFWRCVQDGTPPHPLPAPPMPKPKGVVEYDMSASNAWAINSAIYFDTRSAYVAHEAAKKEIKAAVPDDASKAFGFGLEVRRDKRGALRFFELGDEK